MKKNATIFEIRSLIEDIKKHKIFVFHFWFNSTKLIKEKKPNGINVTKPYREHVKNTCMFILNILKLNVSIFKLFCCYHIYPFVGKRK